MPHKKPFEPIHKNINRCEARLEKYLLPSPHPIDKPKPFKEVGAETDKYKSQESLHAAENAGWKSPPESKEHPEASQSDIEAIKKSTATKYAVFSDKSRQEQPKICTWTYMSQPDVEQLLKLSNRSEIRKTIGNQIKTDYPKGVSRLVAIELMYSLVQFCQKSSFDVKQSGAILSIFYLTHRYFLSSFYTTVEKAYKFFKEYMLLHCFECPPDSIKLFSYDESKHIVLYFCTIYLRNLPLIRLLTLPNFGFYLNYEKQPEPVEEKKPKGKEKKDKKGKKGKK